MKSFNIPVDNNLIEPKHVKAMGSAIWEYLWCLDKLTRIDEGVGKVLGGKPVKLNEIANDIGKRRETVSANLQRLEEAGYLELTRAPYGIVIYVTKAKKWFKVKRNSGNSGKPHISSAKPHIYVEENRISNKDIKVDIKVDNINSEEKKEEKYTEIDKQIVDMLFAKIQRNFNELGIRRIRKPASTKDYETMNLIHRKDKNSYEDIKMVINWCQNDSFWKLNILGVTSLRKKFEQLHVKSQASKFVSPPPSPKDNPNWHPDRKSGGASSISDMLKNR